MKGVELTIRPLENADDADAFRTLNEEWIGRLFTVEDQDRRQLDDPVAAYITTGGQILIAESAGRRVGCVALVPDGAGAYELSKMAVAPELRGQGAGRRLIEAAIAYARQAGATSLFLGSSTKLAERRASVRVSGLRARRAGDAAHALRPRRRVHAARAEPDRLTAGAASGAGSWGRTPPVEQRRSAIASGD